MRRNISIERQNDERSVWSRDARDGWDLTRSIAEASRLPHRRPIIAAIIASDNHCCQRAPRWLLSPSTMTTPSRLLSTPPCCKTAFEETACNRGESLSLSSTTDATDSRSSPMLTIFGRDERDVLFFFFLSFFFLFSTDDFIDASWKVSRPRS